MLVLDAWLTLDQVTLSWAFPNWALVIGFVAVAAPIGVVVWRTLRDAEPRAGNTARWLLVGSWIALVPVLAVVPAPRVLGASILGVAPCVALVLDAMWFPSAIVDRATLPLRERRYAELAGLVAIALGYLHLVHGPATAWLMNRHFRDSSLAYEAQLESMRRLAGDVPGSEIVVVRGMAGSFFAPFAAGPRGAPPVRYYMLSQSSHVLVLRTGERSFDMIGPTDGGVFPLGEGNLYRDLGTPVAEGDTFELPGLRATIVQMSGAWARRVHFEFDDDVDLEDLVWLNENRKGYLSATLPDVGFGRPFDFER
jgi:hypothetical protein